MTPVVSAKRLSKFDPKIFLSTLDGGRKIATFAKKETIFSQGDSSDAVFYIQEGKVKLTVVLLVTTFCSTLDREDLTGLRPS